jgi:hypothetical protein
MFEQIANAKTAEQAMQQIANEYQSNATLCYEAAAAQKYDDAAYYAREWAGEADPVVLRLFRT